MITRALGLVVIGCLTACGAPPDEAEIAGLEADAAAAALTPSSPRPIVWELFATTSNTASIAVWDVYFASGRLLRMSNTGTLQIADAYATKAVWQSFAPLAAFPGATGVTLGALRGNSPDLLFTTPIGDLWMSAYPKAPFRLQTRVSKTAEVKAFSSSDLWMLDQSGGYRGAVSTAGTIAWTAMNAPATTKRSAATAGSISRFVVAVREDNTFWLSRDGGTTFEALASSLDSTMVGAYVVDLEATFRQPVMRTDPNRLYVFALLNGPAGQQIYRGVIYDVF